MSARPLRNTVPPSREACYAALSNLRDRLNIALSASVGDLETLGYDPDYVRQEVFEPLRDLFSDELEWVAERYEDDPLGKVA